MPAFKTILASTLLLGIFFLLELIGSGPYRIEALEGFPISGVVLRIVYVFCWWCFGALIYHTTRQLSLINQIYTKHTRINLFRMKPLYGFSDLSALTAGTMILLPYGFLLVNEEVSLSDPIVLGLYLVFTGLALITFLLPQLGIHRLQQNEKHRLLDEAYQRYDALVAELHAGVDEKKFRDLSKLNEVISMLEKEISAENIEANKQHLEMLAQAWLMSADTERALKPLARAARMSADGNSYVSLARAYMSLSRWSEAESSLKKALEKGNLHDTGGTRLMLGMMQFNQKNFREARRSFALAGQDPKTEKLSRQWLEHLEREEEKARLAKLAAG